MTAFAAYTDDQLVDTLRTGYEDAFNELYERFWKKLLVRAHLLLQSAEDAEEVVHDIFVTLWRKRKRFRSAIPRTRISSGEYPS